MFPALGIAQINLTLRSLNGDVTRIFDLRRKCTKLLRHFVTPPLYEQRRIYEMYLLIYLQCI
jgi:hypothetical protein